MSINQLNPMQIHFINELIKREIVGIKAAIQANKEMMEEYKDNKRLVENILIGTNQIERQLEIWNEIQESIGISVKGEDHEQLESQE